MLLHGQSNVSPQRGLPVDDTGHSSTTVTIVKETAQLYYFNAGVLTVDAGQAAGTVIVAQLAYENVQNLIGSMQATKADTSLSFTAGALTTEKYLHWSDIEGQDDRSLYNRAVALTADLANGEYVVDYANGTIYGKKATTGTTLANVSYKVKQSVAVPASGLVKQDYDYVGVTWTVGTFTEVFLFKKGGASGTTVTTVTVVYTDATKEQLASVTLS